MRIICTLTWVVLGVSVDKPSMESIPAHCQIVALDCEAAPLPYSFRRSGQRKRLDGERLQHGSDHDCALYGHSCLCGPVLAGGQGIAVIILHPGSGDDLLPRLRVVGVHQADTGIP